MPRRRNLCENAGVRRQSTRMRALSALLATLLVPLPGAWAAAPKTPVVALSYAVFPGAPDVGGRVAELLSQELRGRDELKLVELKSPARTDKPPDTLAQAQAALGKAAELARKSRHAAAADALQKAI